MAARQMDVWSNPEWLRQMASRHDALGVQARQRIQDMQQEATLGQQRDVQTENIRVREQGQQNTDRARTDTLRENELVHRDAAAQRALDSQKLTDYRNATLDQQAENAQSRKDLGLLNLAQSPELMTAFGKQAPAIQKELLNRFFQAQQSSGAAGAGLTGGAVLAALGGASAADAGTNAVRNFHVQQGKTTAPSPTTVAPSAAAAKAQAQPPPAPQGGGFAPTDLVGGEAPTAPQPQGPTTAPAGSPFENLPPGYNINVNTGEFVPSNTVGTINGQPAGEAIAQGALRTGISPESPSGTAALRTKQATIAGTGNPNLNEELASAGTFAPSTLAEKPPATNRPFVGSPELFSPNAAPVPTAPAVAGGPGPAPTPGTSKPPGPPVNIDIDKFLAEHVGMPSMEDLQRRQGLLPPQPAPVAGPLPVNLSMNAPSNERQDVSALAASAPPPTVTSPTPPPEYSPPNPAHPAFHPANLVAEAHNKLYGLTPPPGQAGPPLGSIPPPNVLPQITPEQQAALEEQRRRSLY